MSSEDTMGTIGAMMISSHNGPVRTYPRGRTCEEKGCGARLSVYNPRTRCAIHADFEYIRCVAQPSGVHGAQPGGVDARLRPPAPATSRAATSRAAA